MIMPQIISRIKDDILAISKRLYAFLCLNINQLDFGYLEIKTL